MNKYSGIDLHSNNCVVVVCDEEDRVCCERRVPNDFAKVIALLAPFRDDLVSVAVESTFNWYWHPCRLALRLQAIGDPVARLDDSHLPARHWQQMERDTAGHPSAGRNLPAIPVAAFPS